MVCLQVEHAWDIRVGRNRQFTLGFVDNLLAADTRPDAVQITGCRTVEEDGQFVQAALDRDRRILVVGDDQLAGLIVEEESGLVDAVIQDIRLVILGHLHAADPEFKGALLRLWFCHIGDGDCEGLGIALVFVVIVVGRHRIIDRIGARLGGCGQVFAPSVCYRIKSVHHRASRAALSGSDQYLWIARICQPFPGSGRFGDFNGCLIDFNDCLSFNGFVIVFRYLIRNCITSCIGESGRVGAPLVSISIY